MTRVLIYNILIGGTYRLEQIAKIIRSQQPDIVGLTEAIDEQVVKHLAEQLQMDYRLSGHANNAEGWQAALLSRLPIVETKTHANAILQNQPLLEVAVEEDNAQYLTIFVTHLTAEFGKGRAAYHTRRREIQEIQRIMEIRQSARRILMGDFNSLAPGERLKGSSFLQYIIDPEPYYQLHPSENIPPPDLNFVLPPPLRFLKPLLKLIPRSRLLSSLLDRADTFYAPRGGIDLLHKAGYIDCFRAVHPCKQGFTWPAPLPSGPVDFIFACEQQARFLQDCDVIVEGEGIHGDKASDHLPVFADFNCKECISQS